MKKLILGILLLTNGIAFGQSVKKSLTGVEIGLFGAGIYNEYKIGNELVLRSEFSINPNIWWGTSINTGYALYPSIGLQPKWYYSIKQRINKEKNTKNNGANFLSIAITYTPDWAVISNTDIWSFNNAISIIPNWGIRRNFGNKFNYEFTIGCGYKFEMGNLKSGFAFDLELKIGYDF